MLVVALLQLTSTPFKNCVSPDHAHVSGLTISPDPPVHGEHVNLKLTATPDIAITAGTVTVVVTVFGIPVPGGPIFDLCKDVGLTCPLAVGLPATASVVYGVSKLVPAGIDATVELQLRDSSGLEFGCASFDVKISNEISELKISRKLDAQQPPQQQQQQVEVRGKVAPASAPSALTKLLSSPSATEVEQTAQRREHTALLQATYLEQPAWASLFGAWRRQQACPSAQQACAAAAALPPYASPAEEAHRFGAFKATVQRLQAQGDRGGRQPTVAVADRHADKTTDEMRTFAHFA